jgi:protein-L-isoaspartate(D-aspartate) O-methyltransferase
LQGVLDLDRSVLWSDVTVHDEEPFDGVWLRLAATHGGTVRIQADRAAVASGLCTRAVAVRSPALVQDGSLAYFTIRRSEQTSGRRQLGTTGHGPAGRALAERIVEQIGAWGRRRRSTRH